MPNRKRISHVRLAPLLFFHHLNGSVDDSGMAIQVAPFTHTHARPYHTHTHGGCTSVLILMSRAHFKNTNTSFPIVGF